MGWLGRERGPDGFPFSKGHPYAEEHRSLGPWLKLFDWRRLKDDYGIESSLEGMRNNPSAKQFAERQGRARGRIAVALLQRTAWHFRRRSESWSWPWWSAL